MITILLLVTVYMLNLIDYFQTIYAIQLFGIEIEANPIARFLFENNYALVSKVIIMPLMLFAVGIIVRINKRQIWSVYFLTIFYAYVIIHNFIILLQMGAI